MTTATLVPLVEYPGTSCHPDREWVEGELRQRNVGDFSDSSVQKLLLKFFQLRESELGLRVYPALRTQVAAAGYRIPDVLVRESGLPAERILRTPPLLPIEVLLPDDRMSEIQEKVEDYLSPGVQTLRLVDPRRRKAFLVDNNGERPVTELTLAGYDVHLPLEEIFVELTESGEAVG